MPLQESWEIFKCKIQDLANKFIPKIIFHENHQKPWYTKMLKRLEGRKKLFFRAAKLRGSPNARQRYYTAENACLIAVSNAKYKFFNCDLTKLLNVNPRKF